MRRLIVLCFAILCGSGPVGIRAMQPSQAAVSSAATPRLPADPIAIYRAAYSLDYDEAIRLARANALAAPDRSATHRDVAFVIWLMVLFDRGAVTIDHYMGSLTATKDWPKPRPELAAEFRRHLDQAMAIADARLKRQPRDLDAQYDAGAAHGLNASYVGSIEGRFKAAFGSARRAFDLHESLLAADSKRVEAGLVLGGYRYVVATLALPARMLAYVVGFGGGKETGLRLIEASRVAPQTSIDADFALSLLYSREGRHGEALAILGRLRQAFPRNRLLLLEEGASAIRAGRAADAEQALTLGLARHDSDPRPKIPGERAYWLWKRGMARVSLNHLPDAGVDLAAALQGQPLPWVRGRIHLETGRVADLSGRRQEAIAQYRLAADQCARHSDPACSSEAGRLIKQPYRFPPARRTSAPAADLGIR